MHNAMFLYLTIMLKLSETYFIIMLKAKRMSLRNDKPVVLNRCLLMFSSQNCLDCLRMSCKCYRIVHDTTSAQGEAKYTVVNSTSLKFRDYSNLGNQTHGSTVASKREAR